MNISLLSSLLTAPEAYIDPSTGGMLFQILAVIFAAFSGILFFFSRQIRTFFARIRRKLSKEQPEDDFQNTEEDQAPTE